MAPEKFIAILGPSRSGTTLLGAILHAHPDIRIYFEPWHASRVEPPIFCSTKDFCDHFSAIDGQMPSEQRVVGLKETFGGHKAFKWVEETLANIETPITCITILRDPVQSYLSGVDGGKKWWGRPDLVATKDELIAHINYTHHVIQQLSTLVSNYGGLFVSYKSLVFEPEATLTNILNRLSLEYTDEILRYHEKGKRIEVKGDMGVAKQPRPISKEMFVAREREAADFINSIGIISEKYPQISGIINLLDEANTLDKLPI